ncbi:hypothetical protein HPT27_11305 [Permianibacter sp. IMCC34836]|uniref:hypothetical protein n=1 Tax=Permianibacter fluminis TaxID=2738515 RepID=UPI001553D8C3|nr:hypothetical protein [Permianibacter fluminis]NQD37613.1 hypothetical protein [Permianibacter fluminis]
MPTVADFQISNRSALNHPQPLLDKEGSDPARAEVAAITNRIIVTQKEKEPAKPALFLFIASNNS